MNSSLSSSPHRNDCTSTATSFPTSGSLEDGRGRHAQVWLIVAWNDSTLYLRFWARICAMLKMGTNARMSLLWMWMDNFIIRSINSMFSLPAIPANHHPWMHRMSNIAQMRIHVSLVWNIDRSPKLHMHAPLTILSSVEIISHTIRLGPTRSSTAWHRQRWALGYAQCTCSCYSHRPLRRLSPAFIVL